MALPSNLLIDIATHRRPSATALSSSSFPFTTSTSISRSQPVIILFTATGLSTTVSITITGTLNGSPQSETLSIPSTGSLIGRSTKKWSTITQIASASSSSGSITAQLTYGDGQPALGESVVNSSLAGRLNYRTRPVLQDQPQGLVLNSRYVFYTNDLTVRPLDILVIGGVRYEVIDSPIMASSDRHHAEVVLKRID